MRGIGERELTESESSRAAPSAGQEGPVQPSERLVALDLIRGVAVLGILFANVVGFAYPQIAYDWPPALPHALQPADKAVWLVQYLLIDGKMRGLFTLLFGAGLVLFAERARGRGAWLQLRRLAWLALSGAAHFLLLFWGDILLLYALAGFAALAFVRFPARQLLGMGIVWYVCGGLFFAMAHWGPAHVELNAAQPALQADADFYAAWWQEQQGKAQTETAVFRSGSYGDQIAFTVRERAPQLRQYPMLALLETIPLMLIGMAFYRLGLFGGSGGSPPDPPAHTRTIRRWGWAGVAAGIVLTLPLGLCAMMRDFPPFLTDFVFNGAPQALRLPMILGLAVLLAQWAPRAARGWLGERLVAAGRMAFSNYIGTSLLMMLVFRGWAGGLFGQLDRVELLLVVALGWLAMLRWSKPWLARYRYGPLEWCWRCLSYWRLFPMRR